MFSVISGLPGAGKTLWTLVHVEALRKRENRDVYYHGIKDITLPWKLLDDPKKWHDCPPGAIIVIDEAQFHFPTRGASQQVPEHVAKAAVHRHQGHDVFLITQHPAKLDSAIRKDIEVHRHLMRKFGTAWATVHQWQGVRENCDKTRKDSLSSQWRHPKDAYTWYKSAEQHTHRVRVPLKLIAALFLPLIVAGGFAYVFRDRTPEPAPQSNQVLQSAAAGQSASGNARNPPKTASEYLADLTPRVPGLEHTAPAYDGLTTPKIVPVPAACIQWTGKGCKCFTQSGTPYRTTDEICVQIVKHGIFLPFEAAPAEARTVSLSGDNNGGPSSPPVGRP